MRILILGNTGSGKTTMAQRLSDAHALPVLNLDTVAWADAPAASETVPANDANPTPTRRSASEAIAAVEAFADRHPNWIMEGCYGHLINAMLPRCTELRWLDLPIAQCQANCRERPWEPEKYESREAQDANLNMLLQWAAGYTTREDDTGRNHHEKLFRGFDGPKRRYRDRAELDDLASPTDADIDATEDANGVPNNVAKRRIAIGTVLTVVGIVVWAASGSTVAGLLLATLPFTVAVIAFAAAANARSMFVGATAFVMFILAACLGGWAGISGLLDWLDPPV